MGFFRIMFRWFFSMKQDSCERWKDPTKYRGSHKIQKFCLAGTCFLLIIWCVVAKWIHYDPLPTFFLKECLNRLSSANLLTLSLWILMKPIELIPVVFVLRFFSTFYYEIFQNYRKGERILQWTLIYTPSWFYQEHFTILALLCICSSLLEKGMAIHSSILAWRIRVDRGDWQAAVHEVAKSRTRLSD